MAYAFVQKGAGTFTETITWQGATTAGNTLVVAIVKANNAAEWVASLAGNVNATQSWASLVGTINTIGSKIVTGSAYADFGSVTLLILPGSANLGGDTTTTLTVHGDQGGNIWCGAMEFSGLAASPFINYTLGVQAAPGSGTDAVTSGNVNVSTVAALLAGFGFFNSQSGVGTVTGTGFAGRGLDAASNAYIWGEDQRITSTSNVPVTFTDHSGGGDATLAIGIAFAEPSTAGIPAVVSQVQNSSATTVSSLAAPAITPIASDSLVVFVLSSTGSGLTLNDAGVGNVYKHVGGGNSAGTKFLDAYLAQNVIGSPTTITVSAGAASIYAIAVVDVKQCAINNGALGFAAHAQTGSGTAGANLIFSNTIPLANPALMLAINVDLGLTGACTAGTSPLAFTGLTPIWSVFGGGIAVAVIEWALINSTQQATFGSTAANKSDNFLTEAMDIGYFLTFTLQPFTPTQFFVTDTVIQM